MNARLTLLLLPAFLGTLVHAAALREAELTRVVNDVKILPQQQQPVPAKIGDTVRGPAAVSTGAQSRAELRFQDNTITRLGANSIFTIDESSRTVDLEKGTILLQVPKKIGGLPTKIRTAAVTAAITGTTVMVEHLPDGYVKVIVLEGEVDIFLTDDPRTFRTIRPGDMIIMQADAPDIPEPVQVDLKRLKETSKLTSDKNFQALGNDRHLQKAEFKQENLKKKGELHDTRLVILGNGTDVTIDAIRGIRERLPGAAPRPGGPGPFDPNNPNGPGRPGGQGGDPANLRAPLLGGPAVIDDQSYFTAGIPPKVDAWFGGTYATGRGGLYRPSADGGVGQAYFNRPTNRLLGDNSGRADFDVAMRNVGNWTEFRFQQLDIVGQSSIIITAPSTTAIKNLLLSSATNIVLSDTNPFTMVTSTGEWNLSDTEQENLALIARNSITWNSSFLLSGTDQRVLLYTQGDEPQPTGPEPLGTPGASTPSNGDITFDGGMGDQLVDLGSGRLDVFAGRDLFIKSSSISGYDTTLQAADVNLAAKRDVNISTATVAAQSSLKIQSGRTIHIGNSTTLKRLSAMNELQIDLLAQNGNIEIEGGVPSGVNIEGKTISLASGTGSISINNATLSADHLRAITYSPTGALLIGNSTLTGNLGIKLYAQGSNGMVQFVGPTTLNGPATIAGKTVQVNTGVDVTVSNPAQLQIHASSHNYNNMTHGNFTDGTNNIIFTPGVNQHSFSSRPPF